MSRFITLTKARYAELKDRITALEDDLLKANDLCVAKTRKLMAELENLRWRSVEAVLPEKGELVRLFQNKPVPCELKGMLDYLNGDTQFVDEGLYCVDNITHWCLIILPEMQT